MSFGEPNNPYGQQPKDGGQPGYGYPQQTPQGVPSQYGYPQAPPVQQPYGGGYPGAAMEMPGGVKAARVMLWVIGGLNLLGAFAVIAMGVAFDELDTSSASSADAQAFQDFGQGLLIGLGVFVLIFAVLAMVLAAKFKSGGNGVRICSIVYAAFVALFALFSLPLGIISLALGVLIIVFVAKADGTAWFNRHKQQY
ncbi:proline-rich domain-containing protein [Streptomyces sp. NBC_01216]|uniref:proline-rich domain-containing protein n=1 Tax=unclassified Streptomyces TaxID=2593676 RepID=UPI002E0D6E91|nr:hypothetical protein OG393_11760 [Streptomyces sp. NBC_01216]